MIDSDENTKRNDHYERSGLAERLTKVLLSPISIDSLVVALDGPWGSGKSWLLNRIEAHINDSGTEERAKVVRFNPWLIGEESDLILDFLIQVAIEISSREAAQDKAKTASSSLLKYVRILSYGRFLKYAPIPVVDKFGELIDDATSKYGEVLDGLEESIEKDDRPSVSDARASAIDAIKNLGKRLVILIDDVDRLRPKEIRALMQLVKATADFPNTSFLLSFDGTEVARVLADGADAESGRRYLEKIVQLSVSMPPLDKSLIEKDFDKRFRAVIENNKYVLKKYEQENLYSARSIVSGMMKTPRDVVRWANHFSWSLSTLNNSVNVVDLCILEALKLKISSQLWSDILLVVQARGELGSTNSELPNWMEWADIQAPNAKNTLEHLVGRFESQEAYAAVTYLFPHLAEKDSIKGRNLEEHRRLASSLIWEHYKKFGTGATVITGSMVDNYFESPEAFNNALGNFELTVTEEKISNLQEISRLISFDQLPADGEKIQPLIVAIERVAKSQFIDKSLISLNLSFLVQDILLAQAFCDYVNTLPLLIKRLPIVETTMAVEHLIKSSQESDFEEGRRHAFNLIIGVVKSALVSRIEELIIGRSILRERGRMYLICAISNISLSTDKVASYIDYLTPSDADYLKLIGEMENVKFDDIRDFALITLVESPRMFIDRLKKIKDPRFDGLLQYLMIFSEKKLKILEEHQALASSLIKIID